MSPSDNAGTVASFTNGVLTLTLADHSTVSGKVTMDTEIECEAADTTVTNDAQSRGTDSGPGGGDNQPGDNAGNGQGGGDENQGGGNENQGGGDGGQTTCDSSALTPGAVVREAELRIDSSGATFRKVEIVQ